jgi:hypothetical protein
VGSGGFSYRGSSFIVVKIQFPCVSISRAAIKLRASMIFTNKASRFTKKSNNPNRISKGKYGKFLELYFGIFSDYNNISDIDKTSHNMTYK